MRMKLKYIGKNDWDNPVYKDENNRLWADVEMNTLHLNEGGKVHKCDLCSLTNNEIDGEPNYSMADVEKYKDVEVILTFDEIPKPSPREHDYQLLGRLQMDCDYYLGYGNRYEKHLWAGNVKDQIEKMKELYNSFADDEKPEWLTYDDILNYEKEMM